MRSPPPQAGSCKAWLSSAKRQHHPGALGGMLEPPSLGTVQAAGKERRGGGGVSDGRRLSAARANYDNEFKVGMLPWQRLPRRQASQAAGPQIQRPGWGTGRTASVGSDLRQASTWEAGNRPPGERAHPCRQHSRPAGETSARRQGGGGTSGCSLSSDQRWDPSFETGGGTAGSQVLGSWARRGLGQAGHDGSHQGAGGSGTGQRGLQPQPETP